MEKDKPGDIIASKEYKKRLHTIFEEATSKETTSYCLARSRSGVRPKGSRAQISSIGKITSDAYSKINLEVAYLAA